MANIRLEIGIHKIETHLKYAVISLGLCTRVWSDIVAVLTLYCKRRCSIPLYGDQRTSRRSSYHGEASAYQLSGAFLELANQDRALSDLEDLSNTWLSPWLCRSKLSRLVFTSKRAWRRRLENQRLQRISKSKMDTILKPIQTLSTRLDTFRNWSVTS